MALGNHTSSTPTGTERIAPGPQQLCQTLDGTWHVDLMSVYVVCTILSCNKGVEAADLRGELYCQQSLGTC